MKQMLIRGIPATLQLHETALYPGATANLIQHLEATSTFEQWAVHINPESRGDNGYVWSFTAKKKYLLA
jgi:hypothetical protein